MPKLGMSMKKGTVQNWLVAEGETVKEGEPLFELVTDKINAVVEAPASGVLGRVVVTGGTELPVGALLAYIGDAEDAFPDADETSAALEGSPEPAGGGNGRGSRAAAPRASATTGAGEVSASPAARRRAAELGVDITLVPPREPGKRLTTDDVENFAASGSAEPEASSRAGAGRVVPFEGIRRVVAERLHESLQTTAQLTIAHEAEVSGLVARRNALVSGFEAATGIRLSYTDLLISEVATLLGAHGALNSELVDGSIVESADVHMGFAVALEDGLIVPVIRDAQAKSLAQIAQDRVDLAAKTQAGTLGMDEIEGGTFTVSNLGSFGADAFTPIVNPPQCAILGLGRIVDKPVVVQGEVAVGQDDVAVADVRPPTGRWRAGGPFPAGPGRAVWRECARWRHRRADRQPRRRTRHPAAGRERRR